MILEILVCSSSRMICWWQEMHVVQDVTFLFLFIANPGVLLFQNLFHSFILLEAFAIMNIFDKFHFENRINKWNKMENGKEHIVTWTYYLAFTNANFFGFTSKVNLTPKILSA